MENEHEDEINNIESIENLTDESGAEIVPISDILPEELTILPLESRPVFPDVMLPLTFSGKKYIDVIKKANDDNLPLGLTLIKAMDSEDPFVAELHEVGTAVKVFKIIPVDEDTIQVVVKGLNRFKFVKVAGEEPMLRWEVSYFEKAEESDDDELKAYMMAIMASLKELLSLNPLFKEQIKLVMSQITYDKQDVIINTVATMLSADSERLQELLTISDLMIQSEKLLILLKEELELSQLQERIQKQIDEKVSKHQKEFFLREQLKVIKQELGLEKDDKSSEIEKIESKIEELELSDEAAKVIEEELDKLKILETGSAEFQITRSYLKTLVELPWGIYSEGNLNIKRARKVLNEQHYGLDDVKKLILEFISTVIKRGKLTGAIICLVGPPGVGKTSIGRSIADALGREFYRFSVGGMRDEAEIKGHRRTYIGAMPGKIIQSLKRTGVANPVIMLDEIDKIGTNFRGDPASALLEVLDPEQNREFLDHYLDVRFDLSKILFVTTANQLDTIPRPLLDRMEIIKLPGYILEEKMQIAKKYLIPRQIEEHGLSKSEVKITDRALHHIIDGYAREAGVRNLEKQIKKIMRQVTLKHAETDVESCTVNVRNMEKFLGKRRFTTEELYKKEMVGVTLGLAWTSMGGATLYIEASAVKGKSGSLKQTGQLGKVMKESSEIAYSFIRSLCEKEAPQEKKFFDESQIHLHVPAGATPKDGPSAGITMALALYSLASKRAVRRGLAMTGELTLTGKVLPIGGVREKTIAARRVGVFELIFPKENQKDFEELPAYIKKGITAHFVDYFGDVLKVAYR